MGIGSELYYLYTAPRIGQVRGQVYTFRDKKNTTKSSTTIYTCSLAHVTHRIYGYIYFIFSSNVGVNELDSSKFVINSAKDFLLSKSRLRIDHNKRPSEFLANSRKMSDGCHGFLFMVSFAAIKLKMFVIFSLVQMASLSCRCLYRTTKASALLSTIAHRRLWLLIRINARFILNFFTIKMLQNVCS